MGIDTVSPPLHTRAFTLDDFHTDDPAMQRCLELARMAAQTDLPILILGESGTGKTLLARAIHFSSRRRAAPFVSFNAAALSDTLLDSQLFGHEQGAFTGAQKRVIGKFERADKGTLFFDEIADMSLTAQARILRAVEYGEFERLGSERVQVADVRLISATHLSLEQYTASEKFRKDLLFRLSGITLTLPPLRERPRDLASLLAAEIQTSASQLRKPIVGVTNSAMQRLLTHSWPGNLRELNRVINVAVALSRSDVITEDALILAPPTTAPPATVPTFGKTETAGNETTNDKTNDEELNLKNVEQQHIHRVLARMGGNKRQAAQALGISRSTLDRKLGE